MTSGYYFCPICYCHNDWQGYQQSGLLRDAPELDPVSDEFHHMSCEECGAIYKFYVDPVKENKR